MQKTDSALATTVASRLYLEYKIAQRVENNSFVFSKNTSSVRSINGKPRRNTFSKFYPFLYFL